MTPHDHRLQIRDSIRPQRRRARTSKTVGGDTTQYVLDLATTLPVVISDTDALYLYGLDIIAEQLAQCERYYYVHDGLGGARHPSTGLRAGLVDSTGQIVLPLEGGGLGGGEQQSGPHNLLAHALAGAAGLIDVTDAVENQVGLIR